MDMYTLLLEILKYENRQFTFNKIVRLMETEYFVFQEFLFVSKSQNTTTQTKTLCLIIVVRV